MPSPAPWQPPKLWSSEPPLKRVKPPPQSVEKEATPKVLRLCQMTRVQLHDKRKRLMQNVPTQATELEGPTKRLAVIANNLRIRFHDLSAPTLSTIVPPELPPAPTLDIE